MRAGGCRVAQHDRQLGRLPTQNALSLSLTPHQPHSARGVRARHRPPRTPPCFTTPQGLNSQAARGGVRMRPAHACRCPSWWPSWWRSSPTSCPPAEAAVPAPVQPAPGEPPPPLGNTQGGRVTAADAPHEYLRACARRRRRGCCRLFSHQVCVPLRRTCGVFAAAAAAAAGACASRRASHAWRRRRRSSRRPPPARWAPARRARPPASASPRCVRVWGGMARARARRARPPA